MIKFFKKIRRQLLTENKLNKYLLYAVGEIILVMIGILLAIQVSNWNNKRIDNIRAENFILKMITQLEDNKINVESQLKLFRITLKATENYISIIGTDNNHNIDEKIDSLVIANMVDYQMNLNMNTLIEGRENGDLALIKSDSLRQSIYNFSTMFQLVEELEQIANEDLSILFSPYINKNYNIRNGVFALYERYKHVGKSKTYKGDNWKILEDQEFENHIIIRMNYNAALVNSYEELYKILTTTIKLLKVEKDN